MNMSCEARLEHERIHGLPDWFGTGTGDSVCLSQRTRAKLVSRSHSVK